MGGKKAINHEQRRALRNWAHSQHPKPSQKACIEWFQQQFNHQISQSTVSESLSSQFANLDDTIIHNDRHRQRLGQWPNLEAILLKWQLQVEEKGGFTTGEMLQEKARKI